MTSIIAVVYGLYPVYKGVVNTAECTKLISLSQIRMALAVGSPVVSGGVKHCHWCLHLTP